MKIATMSGNSEKATAGRNLLIYSALVAMAAIFTVKVWSERPKLEGYSYPTGLGDGEVYDRNVLPMDPDVAMAKLDGVEYFPTGVKILERRDQDMIKGRRDDDNQRHFYRLGLNNPKGVEIGGRPQDDSPLFIKLDSNEYMEVGTK